MLAVQNTLLPQLKPMLTGPKDNLKAIVVPHISSYVNGGHNRYCDGSYYTSDCLCGQPMELRSPGGPKICPPPLPRSTADALFRGQGISFQARTTPLRYYIRHDPSATYTAVPGQQQRGCSTCPSVTDL